MKLSATLYTKCLRFANERQQQHTHTQMSKRQSCLFMECDFIELFICIDFPAHDFGFCRQCYMSPYIVLQCTHLRKTNARSPNEIAIPCMSMGYRCSVCSTHFFLSFILSLHSFFSSLKAFNSYICHIVVNFYPFFLKKKKLFRECAICSPNK